MTRVAGNFDGQSLAAEIVDYVECPESPPIRKCVEHEVDRPATVDLLASNQRHRVSVWNTLLSLPTQIELHQEIHTPDALVIPDQATTVNQLK